MIKTETLVATRTEVEVRLPNAPCHQREIVLYSYVRLFFTKADRLEVLFRIHGCFNEVHSKRGI